MSTSQSQDKRIALLWDESFLWGVMAYRALREAGLPFRLVTAQDIRSGVLDGCRALFVPGGWASHKMRALGEGGATRIRRFVENGGAYLGICGGAGLATQAEMGLIDVKRVPMAERVPSFSGRIRLNLRPHPLWEAISDPVFYAWWPSQLKAGDDVSVLATYGEASADAFSSDLNVGDTLAAGGWKELEEYYGINLDPGRMADTPAVVSGRLGSGEVLLSLVHFDTPDDPNGATVLRNLWRAWGADRAFVEPGNAANGRSGRLQSLSLTEARPSLVTIANEMKGAVADLVELGMRNFLWFRRNPLMLHWRRGVRGLEYCTLHVLVNEIWETMRESDLEQSRTASSFAADRIETLAGSIEAKLTAGRELLLPFIEEARLLLILERQAMLKGRLTFEETRDPHIRAIREHLFSTSKSHGGLFKEVADCLAALLYSLFVERLQR